MVRQGPGEGLRFLGRRSPRVARAGWVRVDSGRGFALPPDGRRKGAGAARRGALRQRVRYLLRGRQGVLAGRFRGRGALLAALWQAPEGLAGFDRPVHAAFEDRQGRLWFAATDYLLELDGAVWKRHRMPPGLRTHTTQTASLMESPNGRVVVNCVAQDQTDFMLEFDPGSGEFHAIHPPEGRQIVLMAPRRSGGLWAATVAKGSSRIPLGDLRWKGPDAVPGPGKGMGWRRCALHH